MTSTQPQPTPEPAIPLQPLLDTLKSDPAMTHAKWVQWAVACAERALPVFETHHPDDARPRNALAAARAWVANPNESNRRKAKNAANAAAAAAAADAAAYAARDAARAAARAAAWDAARAAARDAADAAAYAARAAAAYAAYAAERQWQALRLLEIYHA